MRGRPPTPIALRLLTNNPGHRPLPEAGEFVAAEVPDPPEHLGGIARKVWLEKAADLAKCGLLCSLDTEMFACYCELVATWLDAKSMIEKQGAVLLAPSGYPVQNPYVAIATRAMDQIRAFGSEFGLSPASRARVTGGVPQVPLFPEDDPMEAYLRANELPDYSGGATAPAG